MPVFPNNNPKLRTRRMQRLKNRYPADNRLNPIARITRGNVQPTHTLCRCANTENPVRLLTCQNVDGLSANVSMGFRHDSSEKE